MEIKLERPLRILENYEELESLHGVKYTGSYSGLFVLSGNGTLSWYEIRKRGNRIELKWEFQLGNSSPGRDELGRIEILYVGPSSLSIDPVKSLVVTKERRGIVSYQVTSTGLEELDVDIRFRSGEGTFNKYEALQAGNIFKERGFNPGLIAKTTSGEMEVYNLDYGVLEEEDSDDFAWSESDKVVGAELEAAERFWIRPGWEEQDLVVGMTNATYVSIFSLDQSSSLQKIGTLTLPSKAGTEPIFQFYHNSKGFEKYLIAYFDNFGIVYQFLGADSKFQPVNHFYFGDHQQRVGKSTNLLISPFDPQLRGPSVCLEGPELLPLTFINSSVAPALGLRLENGAAWKPITILNSPPSIVYAQNQALKLSFLKIESSQSAPPESNLENVESHRPGGRIPKETKPALRNGPNTRWSLYDKSLLDHVTLSQFMEESLQQTSGQLSFQLLLVPPLGFGIRYVSDSKTRENDSFLGQNWEVTGRSFIALDAGRTYYEPEKRYYLVLNDHIYSIEKKAGTSSPSTAIPFTVINKEKTPIRFSKIIWDSVGDSWTIEDSDGAFVMEFGDPSKASVEFGFVNLNWKGQGSELKLSLKWFLIKHRNLVTGKDLSYKYIEELSNKTQPATNIAHLHRVVGPEVEVHFEVGTIPQSETFKLKSLSVKTKKYQQMLQFSYQKIGEVHHLSKISQSFKSGKSDIFQFVMEPRNNLISQVRVPKWRTEIKYSYATPTSLPELPSVQIEGASIDLGNYRSTTASVHGNGYSGFAVGDKLHIYQILTGNVTTFPLSRNLEHNPKLSMDSRCLFLLDQPMLSTYCAELNSTTHSFDWKPAHGTMHYSELSESKSWMFDFGTTFIQDSFRTFTRYQWNGDTNFWATETLTSTSDILSVKVNEKLRIFSWLDAGNTIYWTRASKDSKTEVWNWTALQSHQSSHIDCGSFFASKLDLGPTQETRLKEWQNAARFDVQENVMALSSCSLNDSIINYRINLVVLDNFGRGRHQSFVVPKDDLSTLSLVQGGQDEKSGKNFTLRYWYEKSNGRFLVTMQVDGESKKYNREAAKKFREQLAKEDSRFQLIDFGKYGMGLGPGPVIYLDANETISHTKDQGWVRKKNPNSNGSPEAKLPLGEGLSLTKSRTDETLQIENSNAEVLENLRISNGTDLVYLYPYYIGANSVGSAKVIQFPGSGLLASKEHQAEEFIQAWTGPFVIVTREIDHTSRLHLRTVLGSPQKVLTKIEVVSETFVDKTTHFEYDRSQATLTGKMGFQIIRIIPGKLPKQYGWAQHEYRPSVNGTYERTINSFDGLGNFVETLERDEKPSEEDPDDEKFILMDKSGKFKVTDWTPFELDSCQVGYIGFEDTESFQAPGNCTSWNFPQRNIIKNEFSLTGRNVLRLTGTEKIQMDIPWDRDQRYSIMTWVRPQEGANLTVGEVSPILKASLLSPAPVNWLSVLAYKIGSWSLLRIQIQDEQILSSQALNLPNSTLGTDPEVPRRNVTLRFVITGNQNNTYIDVDHVLFAPHTWDSPISILDPDTMQETETIMGRNGLISRTHFDTFGRPLANINPRDEITHLDFECNEANSEGLVSSWRFKTTTSPGWYELCDPNTEQALLLESPRSWKVGPRKLESLARNVDERFDFRIGLPSSMVFRFSYALVGEDSSFKLNFFGSEIQTRNKDGAIYFRIAMGGVEEDIEVGMENSIILAVLDQRRFAVWVNHGLVTDTYLNSTAYSTEVWFKVSNQVIFSDMVFLPDPSIEVKYSTLIPYQEIQKVSLVSPTSIQVSQTIYDELTRPVGQTKKTLITTEGPVFGFRRNFVVERRETTSSLNLYGEVHENNMADKGYPFTGVQFQDNVVKQEWESEGMPGENYSLGGKFETKYGFEPNSKVKALFPPDQGYTYRVVRNAFGFEETSVYQKAGKKHLLRAKVALLPLGPELLSTFKYDFQGNLIETQSPEFHRIHRTFLQGVPYTSIQFNETSPASQGFQSRYKFDSRNRLIEMQTPDGGITNYSFDNWDNLVTTEHRPRIGETTDMLLYFEYSNGGRGTLSEVGLYQNFNASAPLSTILASPERLEKTPKKLIRTLDTKEKNIFRRSDLITSIFDEDRGYVESVGYEVTLSKPTLRYEIIPTEPGSPALLAVTQYKYNVEGDKLLEIKLPFQNWVISNKFDRLGNHMSLDLVDYVKGRKLSIAKYEYNGENQVVTETLSAAGTREATLETEFGYNSPGFPTSNMNSLVKETYSYEDEGYGGFSLGKANAIMSSQSQRLWKNPTKRFLIRSLVEGTGVTTVFAERCLAALTRRGYFQDGRIQKMYYPNLMDTLPYECRVGEDAQKFHRFWSQEFVAQQNSFGFKYQFGGHGDLIKVKFVDNTSPDVCSEPLTPTTLSRRLPGLETSKIVRLWSSLVRHHFLIQDKVSGMSILPHGQRGKLLTHPAVVTQLQALGLAEDFYIPDLVTFLGRNEENSTITGTKISSKIGPWLSSGHLLNPDEESQKILSSLKSNNIIEEDRITDAIFDPGFKAVIKDIFGNTSDIFTIFGTLTDFFGCSIGSSPFDFQVLDQDANGNFKIFYNGAQLVRSEYTPGTNKLAQIQISEFGKTKKFPVTHDSFGNLNSAPHKGVQAIKYDPVFARPVKFSLKSGQEVRIRYDYKGERVSKELWSAPEVNSTRRILFRKKYLTRDNENRCLLEDETWFASPDLPPRTRTTIYMYGPRGLVGFYRNGKLYNVYTDNINSVRFVLLNGWVVASYDYLPYGELMAQFLDHSDAEISYRFTGQELDQELGGLYNFHARIYDPSLGRFYQMDPKQQFFSPYKYGGNSPLNVVDPDGKFIAITTLAIIIAFSMLALKVVGVLSLAALGAYLTAAAANGEWNPKNWDWKSPGTWLSLIFGGLAGALLPFGGAASFAFLTTLTGSSFAAGAIIGVTTLVTTYLNVAATQQTLAFWTPEFWEDWDRPGFASAVFGGVSLGVSLFAGVEQWVSGLKSLKSAWGISLYCVGSAGAAGGFAYFNNVAAYKSYNPRDWNGFAVYHGLTGGFSGFIGTAGLLKAGQFFTHQGYKLFKRVGLTDPTTNVFSSARHSATTTTLLMTRPQWIALGKIVGALGALAFTTYLGVASGANAWIDISFKKAETVAGLFDGMWNGFIFTLDASSARKLEKIRRAKITKAKLTRNLVEFSQRVKKLDQFKARFTDLIDDMVGKRSDQDINVKWTHGDSVVMTASDSRLIMALGGASDQGPGNRQLRVLAVVDDYMSVDPKSRNALTVFELSDKTLDPSLLAVEKIITAMAPSVDESIRNVMAQRANSHSSSVAAASSNSPGASTSSLLGTTNDLALSPKNKWKLGKGELTYSKVYDFKDLDGSVNSRVSTDNNPPNKWIMSEDGWKQWKVDMKSRIADLNRQINDDYASYPFFYYVLKPEYTTVKPTAVPRAKRSTNLQQQLLMTSGASASSGIVLEIVKGIKGWIQKSNSNAQEVPKSFLKTSGKGEITEWSILSRERTEEPKQGSKPRSSLDLSHCVPYAWQDGEYRLDAFTCTNALGTVKVFPMHQGNEQAHQLAPSSGGDSYGSCQFLLSSKSAYCEGAKTKFLYQPAELILPFDRINDHLLLLLVGLNLWRSWTCDERRNAKPEEEVQISRALLEELLGTVGVLQDRLETCGDEQFQVWGKFFLEDRCEDLRCFRARGVTTEALNLFQENLSDFEMELEEIETLIAELDPTSHAEIEKGPNSMWRNLGDYLLHQFY